MKKLLVLMAVLAVFANFAMADSRVGTSPQFHAVTVDVIIPPRVGIDIILAEHTKSLNLLADLSYPPGAPTYWLVGTNLISVYSMGTYTYTYGCAFAGPVGSSLVMGDLEYQANGWAGPGWTGFLAGPITLEGPGHARTVGWETRDMDYQVLLDGSEIDGTHTWTITYTITSP